MMIELHTYGGGAVAETTFCEHCAPDPVPCPACVASGEDGCHPMCSGYEVEPWDDQKDAPKGATCEGCGLS